MNTMEVRGQSILSHPSFLPPSGGENNPVKQNMHPADTSIETLLQKKTYQTSPTEKLRIEHIEKALKAAISSEKRWEFSVHKELNEVMVKVIDRETKEVIREVPPEKLLDMVAGMLKTAGLLIDKKW